MQLISSADIGLMHIRNDWIAHQIGSANRYLEYSHAGLAILSTYQDTAVEVNKKNTTLDNINQIKELLISMSEINQIAKQIK